MSWWVSWFWINLFGLRGLKFWSPFYMLFATIPGHHLKKYCRQYESDTVFWSWLLFNKASHSHMLIFLSDNNPTSALRHFYYEESVIQMQIEHVQIWLWCCLRLEQICTEMWRMGCWTMYMKLEGCILVGRSTSCEEKR